MPDRHKTPTVSVRFEDDGDRKALEDYAARHGISRHAAILRAVREMLERDAELVGSEGG